MSVCHFCTHHRSVTLMVQKINKLRLERLHPPRQLSRHGGMLHLCRTQTLHASTHIIEGLEQGRHVGSSIPSVDHDLARREPMFILTATTTMHTAVDRRS